MSDENKTILIVDDEPDVRAYLERLFRENGYAVESAGDGEQALRAVAAGAPALITLDMSMPNMSGVKFYREIKARDDLRGIPVVVVTGVTGHGGSAADTERFLSTRGSVPPPDGFIAKPIDQTEILSLVGRLTGSESQ
jgi:CheY-like chemotaxis protein